MRMDKLTSKFQMAIADAQSLAVGQDHQFIEPAHVMIALLDQQGGTVRVRGTLELVGRSAPLELTLRARDGRLVGEVEFKPSRWGIKPYKALAGAIKLQDRVKVRVDLARDGT